MPQSKPIRMAHSKPTRRTSPKRMGLMEDPVLSDRDKEIAAAFAEGIATVQMYSGDEDKFPMVVDGMESAFGKQNAQDIMALTEKAQELMTKLSAENNAAIVVTSPDIATMGLRGRQPAMSQRQVDAAAAQINRHPRYGR